MTIRRNKVQTAMHPIVLNILPVQSTLIGEILPKLLVDIRRTHSPALLAVDGIPEPGRVHNGQAQSNALLLDVHRFPFDSCRLLDPFVRIGHRPTTIQIAQEEAVHHRRFAETRFADHHQCKFESSLYRFSVHLLGQRGKTDVVAIAIEATADACLGGWKY